MTGIQWTDQTWNPVTGCDRISPGCDHCYAAALAPRLKAMGQAKYQADGDPRTSAEGFAVTCHPETLAAPFGWRRPRRVFVNSMSDLWHARVPDEFAAEVFAVMTLTPRHSYQVLTKRPRRMARLLADPGFRDEVRAVCCEYAQLDGLHDTSTKELWERWPAGNVWLGVSVETDRYTWRADVLRRTPAAVRFLSLEPLLGPLPSLDLAGIGWVIVGGESGPGARPLDLGWVREVRDRCRAAAVPLFVKQLGTCWAVSQGHGRSHGADPQTWPADLRLRAFPHPGGGR